MSGSSLSSFGCGLRTRPPVRAEAVTVVVRLTAQLRGVPRCRGIEYTRVGLPKLRHPDSRPIRNSFGDRRELAAPKGGTGVGHRSKSRLLTNYLRVKPKCWLRPISRIFRASTSLGADVVFGRQLSC